MKSTSSRAAAPLWALLLLAAAAAGCPESLTTLCPDNTKQEGLFTTAITLQSGNPNLCQVTADVDGGPLDASVTLAASSRTFSAALCSSRDTSDGGPLLWLAVAQSSTVRNSPLGDGGTFTFGTDTYLPGTACGCQILVSERISGRILPTQDDAGVELTDAGLPALKGFSGTLIDQVDAGEAPGSGAACRCNLPCNIAYDLSATKQ